MMKNNAKILVVEDEQDIRELMLLHLKREGHQATPAANGEDALKILNEKDFDLVVLDWMLPGVSGLEICKRIKDKLPILMVTARADTSDIVLGLEMGADDYITKPFEVPVFIARVRALLRRKSKKTEASVSQTQRLQIGNLLLDTETYKVSCSGEPLTLTPSEFKLLQALMESQGRVLSREKLIESVQGLGVAVVDRTVDTHVFGLRKKLGSCADIIETIRGVGYRVQS